MTTETMVHRVAQAIYANRFGPDGLEFLEKEPWRAAIDTARAAIEAMRKLTPEMLQAGQGWDGIPATWNRMIDAALKE